MNPPQPPLDVHKPAASSRVDDYDSKPHDVDDYGSKSKTQEPDDYGSKSSSHAPPELEWELPSQQPRTKPFAFATVITSKLRAGLPTRTHSSNKRKIPFNLSRRTFIILCAALALVLLALILGLSIGLTVGRKSSPQNLPLPNNSDPQTGDLTYYEPGLGACGITSTSAEDIVAVSHILYDAVQVGGDPNSNPLCGRRIRARRGERSVDLTVVDRCTGCAPTDIDVSTSVFDRLAERDQGRVLVTWAWLN